MNNKQQGFTLIELVVVIVILGILAAVAVPRFVNMQGDARFAVLQGVAASMQSTSALIHAKALAQNQTGATGSLPAGSVEGIAGTIALVNGYPDLAVAPGPGINLLLSLQPAANFVTTTAGTVQMAGVTTPANCQVVYTNATAALPPGIATTGNAANCK